MAEQNGLGRTEMMPATSRYACLDAREFPLQALLRLRPELLRKPVAVFDGEPPFEQVCSLNEPALALGIVPGMTKLEMRQLLAFPGQTEFIFQIWSHSTGMKPSRKI